MTNKNVFYTQARVSRDERKNLLKQQGLTIWLTGLSGSGKTTIATTLDRKLLKLGFASYVLDGDNIRHGLSSDLGFCAKDRKENIRRISEACCLFSDAGLITIGSFISPYEKDRSLARNLHKKQNLPFFEIFVNTPLNICEKRDVKGLYKKARSGEIKDFTGISSLYETPRNPDITLSPHNQDIESCCDEVIKHLTQKRLIHQN